MLHSKRLRCCLERPRGAATRFVLSRADFERFRAMRMPRVFDACIAGVPWRWREGVRRTWQDLVRDAQSSSLHVCACETVCNSSKIRRTTAECVAAAARVVSSPSMTARIPPTSSPLTHRLRHRTQRNAVIQASGAAHDACLDNKAPQLGCTASIVTMQSAVLLCELTVSPWSMGPETLRVTVEPGTSVGAAQRLRGGARLAGCRRR